MHISGGFHELDKEPMLYQSLLNTQYDIDIGEWKKVFKSWHISASQSTQSTQSTQSLVFSNFPVDAIRIDLPRTFPENIFFESIRTPLFNVLIAYSNHNKDIGYCQGLNYIAGLILLVTKNEEWTFWLLKVLVEKITSSYHTKTMTGLITDIAVLREMLMERAPDVCEHLERCGLPCAVITTKWFICMFAEVLPIETVLRIWDCLFHEGSKVIVNYQLFCSTINSIAD